MASSNLLGGSNFRESPLISIKSYPALALLSSGSGYGTYLIYAVLCYLVRVDVRITAMHLSFKTGRATFTASGS
jgi:hypothetical protein